MTRHLVLPAAASVLASAVLLAGCASSPADAGSGDDGQGRVSVVAATSVYGQIAQQIGGDAVEVTSLISAASQDPHAYEPSARDQLTVSRADLVIENGGGYDPFVNALIQSSGTDAPVLTAVESESAWPGGSAVTEQVEGFNEHVWYDLSAMVDLARAVASELGMLRPDDAATFDANADAFATQVAGLKGSLAAIAADHSGADIFVTEPVPLYLTAAAGLVNTAPAAFTEAVEEGQDVPPATLLESLDLVRSGTVDLLIVNAQTGGAETGQVADAAAAAGVPEMKVTETLPDGTTYIEWMQQNIDDIAAALRG